MNSNTNTTIGTNDNKDGRSSNAAININGGASAKDCIGNPKGTRNN